MLADLKNGATVFPDCQAQVAYLHVYTSTVYQMTAGCKTRRTWPTKYYAIAVAKQANLLSLFDTKQQKKRKKKKKKMTKRERKRKKKEKEIPKVEEGARQAKKASSSPPHS